MIIEIKFPTFIDKWWSCERKVRYGHRLTAEKACAAMTRKYSEEMEAYECRHCDGWHIAHARPSAEAQ